MNETRIPETITLEEAASILQTSKNKVNRLIEEQALIAIQENGEQRIPKILIQNGHVIPALRGTLILLTDIGLSTQEKLEWLLTENDHLDQTPLEALGKGHKAPVRRAAQLLAELY